MSYLNTCNIILQIILRLLYFNICVFHPIDRRIKIGNVTSKICDALR